MKLFLSQLNNEKKDDLHANDNCKQKPKVQFEWTAVELRTKRSLQKMSRYIKLV